MQPLRGCFGVLCPHHGRCARYAAVVDSEASAHTMGTCASGEAFPLFVEIADPLRLTLPQAFGVR